MNRANRIFRKASSHWKKQSLFSKGHLHARLHELPCSHANDTKDFMVHSCLWRVCLPIKHSFMSSFVYSIRVSFHNCTTKLSCNHMRDLLSSGVAMRLKSITSTYLVSTTSMVICPDHCSFGVFSRAVGRQKCVLYFDSLYVSRFPQNISQPYQSP